MEHSPVPYCPNHTTVELVAFPKWMECDNNWSVCHIINGSNEYILHWSHKVDERHLCQKSVTPGWFVSTVLTFSDGGIQRDLWHRIATIDFINFTGIPLPKLVNKYWKAASCYGLKACVQFPYVLITVNIKVNRIRKKYHVTVITIMTNCITKFTRGQETLVLRQLLLVWIQLIFQSPGIPILEFKFYRIFIPS